MASDNFEDPADELEQLRRRIAELERAHADGEEALAERVRLFEEMLETVPVGMVIADANGKILYGNGCIEQMVGHEVLLSKDVDAYGEWVSFHPDGRQVEGHEYPLAKVYSGDVHADDMEVHYQRPDGSRFWMKIIAKSIRNDVGKRIGAAVATIDVDLEHRARDAQQVMIMELNHRVKSAFSVTQAIVNRTLRNAGIDEEVCGTLDKRLLAYADAHARLVGTEWNRAPLRDVALEVLTPIAGDRLDVDGPDVPLFSRTGLSLSMVFYELATNAVKHGALSSAEGRIGLRWWVEDATDGKMIVLEWRETGGPLPRRSAKPNQEGFGSFIVKRAVAGETGGTVDTRFADEGYVWRLTMPREGNADV